MSHLLIIPTTSALFVVADPHVLLGGYGVAIEERKQNGFMLMASHGIVR